MDNRAEVREFLTSRRDRITPEQVGLPAGPNRRVKGLRRTEVAVLAGVSVACYPELRRRQISRRSPAGPGAPAKALRLDDAGRAHLFDPAQAASPVGRPPKRRAAKSWSPSRGLQWALDGFTA